MTGDVVFQFASAARRRLHLRAGQHLRRGRRGAPGGRSPRRAPSQSRRTPQRPSGCRGHDLRRRQCHDRSQRSLKGSIGTISSSLGACQTALNDLMAAQDSLTAAQNQLTNAADTLDDLLDAWADELETSAPSTTTPAPTTTTPAPRRRRRPRRRPRSTTRHRPTTASTGPAASGRWRHRAAVHRAAARRAVARLVRRHGSHGGSRGPTAGGADRLPGGLRRRAQSVDAANQAIAQATIVSPIAGSVVTVDLAAGETVTAASDTQTIVVQGDGGYEATLSVSVDDIDRIDVGQSAELVPDGGGAAVTGQVVAISEVPDSSGTTANYRVTVGSLRGHGSAPRWQHRRCRDRHRQR